MGQHNGRADAPVAVHDLVDELRGLAKRVVAGIEEIDRRAKNLGCAGRLGPPDRLDLVELLSVPPGPRGLTPLAEAQAHDSDRRTACRGDGHRAACSPDEISGMGTDYQDWPVLAVSRAWDRGHLRCPATTTPRPPVRSRRSARAWPTAA